jgi:hypothetical protein
MTFPVWMLSPASVDVACPTDVPQVMEESKARVGIREWGITQTSLEEVCAGPPWSRNLGCGEGRGGGLCESSVLRGG